KGQPPQWLYWDAAHERAGHIWNIYSPEDFVQGKLAEWFHGIPRDRRALLTRQRYSGTEQKPVTNVEIRWQRRLSAHRNLHSDSIGLCVGALLRGATIPEAMETAGLSMVALNKDRPRGGWPGIERTFKTLQMLSDPRPFDLGDSTNRVGILFVHGFTASPSEMRPMAQFVSDSKGWRCSAVLLPGHGSRVQDMQNADADDWVDAVQRAYEAMARGCDDVLLVGLSLGAVLCCHAALRQSQNSKLRGLLLLAPAFAVTRSRALGLKLLRPFHNLASKGKRASDYFLDNRLYTYLQLPLNLAVQVMQLGQKAAASMGKLRAIPVMMFVGDRESTVSLERVLSVARENPWIRLVRLQHSRHILTVEPDQQILFETSVRFMEECLSGGTSPEAEKSIS
ncbi:MAG TPA: alpha/beta fold hydrolase, partial [Terriglobia bacterium]|nr:alpha/beta fold hydrolase [Terriglobia bacterium]